MEFINSFCVRDFTGTKRYNISNIKTKINKIKFKSATGKNCFSYFITFGFACALILSLYLHSSHPKIKKKKFDFAFVLFQV